MKTSVLCLFVCFVWTAVAGPALVATDRDYPDIDPAIARRLQSCLPGPVLLKINGKEATERVERLPASLLIDNLPLSDRLVTAYNAWFEYLALFQVLLDVAMNPHIWSTIDSELTGLDINKVVHATRTFQAAISRLLMGLQTESAPEEFTELVRAVEDTADHLEMVSSTLLRLTFLVARIRQESQYEPVINKIMVRLKAMDMRIIDSMHAEIYDYMDARRSAPPDPPRGNRPLPLPLQPPSRPLPVGAVLKEPFNGPRPLPAEVFQAKLPPPKPLEQDLKRHNQVYRDPQLDVHPQTPKGAPQFGLHIQASPIHGQRQPQTPQGQRQPQTPQGQPQHALKAAPNAADIVATYVRGLIQQRIFPFYGKSRFRVRLPKEEPVFESIIPSLRGSHSDPHRNSLRNYAMEWFKTFARCQWIVSDQEARPIKRDRANPDEDTRLFVYLWGQFEDFVIAIDRLQDALAILQSYINSRRPAPGDFIFAQFTEIKRNQWQTAVKKYEQLLRASPRAQSFISALSRAYTVPEDALKYITDTTYFRLNGARLSDAWHEPELEALRAHVIFKVTGETGTRAVACDAVNQWSPWAPTLKDRWFACAQRSAFLIPVRGSSYVKFKVIPVPSRLMLYHGSRTLPPRTVPDGRNWFGGYRVALIYVGVDFGKELHRGFHEGIHAFQTVRELNVVRLMDRDNNDIMDWYLEHAQSKYRMRHLTGFRPGVNAPLKRTSTLEIDREVFEYLCILWTKLGIHGYADDYEHDQGLHPEMMLCNPHGLIVPIDLPPWPPAPLERLSTKPLYYQFQPLQQT